MPAGACPEEGSLAGGIPEAARPAVGSLEEDSLEEDIPEGENPVEEMSHHLQKKNFYHYVLLVADNPEEDIPEEERRQGDNPEARLVAPSCPAADSPEERPQQARQREVEHQLEHQLPGQLE